MILNHLVRGYFLFPQNIHFVLKQDVEIILTAFQESIKKEVLFPALHNAMEQVISEKNAKSHKFSFFSSQKVKEKDELTRAIISALTEDLAEIIPNDISLHLSQAFVSK